MIDANDIAAVVLAGGRARRLHPDRPDGGDKALVPLAGVPMVGHVLRTLTPHVDRIVLNANGNAQRFSWTGLPVIADARPDEGPLSGLLAAMAHLSEAAAPHRWLLSVSTDTPFLPEDLVLRLAQSAGPQPAIATSADRRHPVIGLWPVGLQGALALALQEGRRSVDRFAARHEAIAVAFPMRTMAGRHVDPFFNVNTPEDHRLAEQICAARAADVA